MVYGLTGPTCLGLARLWSEEDGAGVPTDGLAVHRGVLTLVLVPGLGRQGRPGAAGVPLSVPAPRGFGLRHSTAVPRASISRGRKWRKLRPRAQTLAQHRFQASFAELPRIKGRGHRLHLSVGVTSECSWSFFSRSPHLRAFARDQMLIKGSYPH